MLKSILNLLMTHLGLSPAFVAILEPVVQSATTSVLDDATVAAEPIVADLEKGTLPSSAKADEAVKQVVAKVEAQGKTLTPSIAHLAVELALQKVKSAL